MMSPTLSKRYQIIFILNGLLFGLVTVRTKTMALRLTELAFQHSWLALQAGSFTRHSGCPLNGAPDEHDSAVSR